MDSRNARISRFDHVTIAVADLEQAIAAYTAILGAAPVWRGTHPDNGTQTALFGVGNALIEFTAPLPDNEAALGLQQWIAERGEGIQALAFGTDDAQACSSQLRERGVRCTPPQAGTARAEDGSEREYTVVELSPKAARGLPVLIVQRPDALQLMAAERSVAPECVERLDHVVIRTAEFDAALALYGTGLGIRLALDTQVAGARMLFFRVGGVTLEVVPDSAGAAQDRFYGVAYRVRDLDAAHARMSRAGLDISEIRTGNKPGTRVFSVRRGSCGVPTLILRDASRD
jgi:catechol 2,3-dioxygenase-like lactoylglutathione lyase family enzyme